MNGFDLQNVQRTERTEVNTQYTMSKMVLAPATTRHVAPNDLT
jgi:hypothetical protein